MENFNLEANFWKKVGVALSRSGLSAVLPILRASLFSLPRTLL